jgi:nucleoside-diphosphate-sugar epimerase
MTITIGLVGATGVYGQALAPLLLDAGHQVRVLARSAAKARDMLPAGIDVVEGDLLDPATDLTAFLRGCDAAAHIATAIPRDMGAPGAWDLNTRLRTEGTRWLVDAALAAGVERYLQQSIVMAYPDRGDAWITEDTPLADTPERASLSEPVKIMEATVRAVPTDRLRWCILRGGAFLGKGAAQDGEIERLRAGTLTVPCDGSSFFSPIHVDDMAGATAAAFERAPAGSIYNIVHAPLRLSEYFDHLAELVGAPRPPRDSVQPCPPSCRCSNQAARDALGWTPTHSIFPEQVT